MGGLEDAVAGIRIRAHDLGLNKAFLVVYPQSGSRDLEPEKRLKRAMLQDAIDVYRKNLKYANFKRGERKEKFQEVKEWIFEEINPDWVFSFENICETLGIDPGYVRRQLNMWKEQFMTSHQNTYKKHKNPKFYLPK